jgi:hypothetical protein
VHLKLGDARAALADYDSVLATNPTDASSLYGRGLARQRSGDASGGGADMQAATAIQPDIADQFAKWGIAGKPESGKAPSQTDGERKNAR